MIRQFIIKLLFRKDVGEMAVIYATLIVKGKKNFADVPERIKEQVKEVLMTLIVANLQSSQGNVQVNEKTRYMTVI